MFLSGFQRLGKSFSSIHEFSQLVHLSRFLKTTAIFQQNATRLQLKLRILSSVKVTVFYSLM